MLGLLQPYLALIAGFCAFFGVLLVIFGLANRSRSNPVQQRLKDATQLGLTPEEMEMQRPFIERILRPLTSQLSKGVARFTPTTVLENTQRRLNHAGLTPRLQVADYIGLQFLSMVIGIVLAIGLALLTAHSVTGYVLYLALGVGAGYLGPMLWLRGKITERKTQLANDLPDVIDLLTVSVEAGLGFDQAVAYIVAKSNTLLAREFRRFLLEKDYAYPNAVALRNIVERTGVEDLSAFVGALIQAEETGARLGGVLRIQASEMRVRRRQRAQTQAQQAPIKMIFPLVLLIFPPILIVVLGPAIPRIIHLIAPHLAL